MPSCKDVLDAGCGHGEFTIKMTKYTRHICAFDFAEQMIRVAERLKFETQVKNVDFFYATTKQPLPFKPKQFDLIYNRRGPISVVDHSDILKDNGIILGIHSEGLDLNELRERLSINGFSDIEIKTFSDAYLCFPTGDDFARYLSASHLNPDYMLPENFEEFNKILNAHTRDGEIILKQIRHVWSARKAKI